jgi:crotonobetainyl-CoA:carnitine CoA-transferase CaiB-like acyl-CoA transferase
LYIKQNTLLQGVTMTGALDQIKVLDLTHVLAGPFCTYQLGLLGADVVKVEDPLNPDCARGRGPDAEENAKGLGLNYQVQGGNKRALALDLRNSKGADVLREMVRSADVLVENYATGALAGLGLGYDDLVKENPSLIYCSITGYGNDGPQATQGAYDNVIQATSGTIAQCGGIKPGVSFVDYATGYAAAFAITSALTQRARTGQGTQISVSMLEVAMQMMAPEAAAAQYKNAPKRAKEAGIMCYPTAEGELMLGAFHPAQYRKLAAFLGGLSFDLPALANIQIWPDVWAIDDVTKAKLRDIFLQRKADDWVALLRDADLPAERVKTLAEAVQLPQLEARGYFQPNPDAQDTLLPAAAFSMTNGGASLRSAPPKHGEHTRDVLNGMGLSADQIAQLYVEGIVA